MDATPAIDGHAVILFDGVCNLCNFWVDFVLRRDRRAYFKFASLQSPEGRRLLESRGLSGDYSSSVVLVEGNRVHQGSGAVAAICSRLGWPWKPLGWLLWAVPRPVREAGYRYVAKRRYDWFGKRETCRLPTPEERSRFL